MARFHARTSAGFHISSIARQCPAVRFVLELARLGPVDATSPFQLRWKRTASAQSLQRSDGGTEGKGFSFRERSLRHSRRYSRIRSAPFPLTLSGERVSDSFTKRDLRSERFSRVPMR